MKKVSHPIQTVLSIETSCDDTSVAIIQDDQDSKNVRVNFVLDQNNVHLPFSGIVPEMAGRKHLEVLLPLIHKGFSKTEFSWAQIDGIAVTQGPGLMGSLLVGILTAEVLAITKQKPLIGVNHLEGHILSPFLKDENYQHPFNYTKPFLALIVSGGHTSIYKVNHPFQYTLLETTVDDAAGEALDKLAQMLGLGFPGGAKIDNLAQDGDRKAFKFPRPLIKSHNFSFSGLKTAALRLIKNMKKADIKNQIPSICASYQEAIVDVLLSKLSTASKAYHIKNIVITGGVSANSRLRKRAQKWAKENHLTLAIPPLCYCTDNAAMIGLVGLLRLQAGHKNLSPLTPQPTLQL